MLFPYIFLSLPSLLLARSLSDYTADNFPNPRRMTDAKACSMRSISSVCDPYIVGCIKKRSYFLGPDRIRKV